LDTTTHWAVVTAGATLSFTFSQPDAPHFVIILNSILIAFFLSMEARRYRYYEIWSSRVRMLETGYFAPLLSPDGEVNEEWAKNLAEEFYSPNFTISVWEAVGRRLRRNYLWIFALLAVSWVLKLALLTTPSALNNPEVVIKRAAIGPLPGSIVVAFSIAFHATLFIFAVATIRLREATGEVLPPPHEFSLPTWDRMKGWSWTREEAPAETERRHQVMTRRTKKARARMRTSTAGTTGEWKRPDIEEEFTEETYK
jgi:uncharacterized membrane protein